MAEDCFGDVDLDIYDCVYPSVSNKGNNMPFELKFSIYCKRLFLIFSDIENFKERGKLFLSNLFNNITNCCWILLEIDDSINIVVIEVLNHYVKEITFEKTQMTDKEMTDILEFLKAKILKISNFLMSIEPLVGTVQSRYIEYSASKQMYFNFTKEYQPLKTPPAGNCLYHMISLCLIGNTTLMLMLRVLTVFSLLNLKAKIMQLLKWEYETTHSDNQGSDNYLDHEYIDILNSARGLSYFSNLIGWFPSNINGLRVICFFFT